MIPVCVFCDIFAVFAQKFGDFALPHEAELAKRSWRSGVGEDFLLRAHELFALKRALNFVYLDALQRQLKLHHCRYCEESSVVAPSVLQT